MGANKIREYIMVKDSFSHAKLEEIGCYDYYGELKYTDHIYDMLNRSFKMDSLITEVSYVIAFDHKKMPKGICKVGQGGLNETPTPMQPIFTFLLLTGASSFIVAHNHISDMPEVSGADQMVTEMIGTLAASFDMEFIGHMVISPNGYVIDGGTIEEECGNEEDILFDDSKAIHITSENMYEVAKMLRKRAERR